jgi:hypothetical protein
MKKEALTLTSDIFGYLGLYPIGQIGDRELSLAAPEDKSFLAVIIPGIPKWEDFIYLVDHLHINQNVTTVFVIAKQIKFHNWGHAEGLGKQGYKFVLASIKTIGSVGPLRLSKESDLAIFPQKVGTESVLAKYIRRLRYDPQLRSLRELALNESGLNPASPVSMSAYIALHLLRLAKSSAPEKGWPAVINWDYIFTNEFTSKQLELLSDALFRGGLTLEEFHDRYRYYTTNDV